MNTDDYEGHTPAPWKIELFPELYAVRETYYDEDLKLIAAAPDLLAEVKQLQKQVKSLLHSSSQRLERLQEHEISDPVWEAEYDTDEYTGESIE